jgi:2-dehydro-3-deoxyphosphogluconate aldolase/(4S)-4-hydroxy-2-oxoglutarate aldolase
VTEQVLDGLSVLPVVTVDDAEQALATAAALSAGGLRHVEIVLRSDAAVTAVERLAATDAVVGAGTVLSVEQVDRVVDAGARFVVAPALDADVAAACRERGVPYIPGVATPTEIHQARALGLRLVKLFPAEQLGGPAFVRAVAAVFPDVRFIPTGGVGPDNLPSYLALPAVHACGGSWMVKPELLRAGRYDEVERLAAEAARLSAATRSSTPRADAPPPSDGGAPPPGA